MPKKIAVAMSGGVDSSVAAALLKKQGYNLTGLHLICWQAPGCPAEKDKEDARRVAGKLEIPFYVIDAVEEYRSLIINEMVREYAAGRTPNPDVWCNERIKFGFLLEKARGLGFDFFATGHYARLCREFSIFNFQFPNKFQNPNFKIQNKLRVTGYGLRVTHLFRGIDLKKDQSYFLWRLNQDQLSAACFPIGEFYKTEVRQKAKEFGLHTASKKDSQGLCFVGQLNMREFLKDKIFMESGLVKLISGKEIGRHDGLFQYTIGQRASIGGPGPFYVVALDQKNNTLIVTNNPQDPQLFSQTTKLEQIHWISDTAPSLPFSCLVDIRYHTEPVSAELQTDGLTLIFKKPVRALTCGQSAVFYLDDELVGGGIIKNNPLFISSPFITPSFPLI